MKKLIAGNWKMNGTGASAAALVDAVGAALQGEDGAGLLRGCDFLVCPPALHIPIIRKLIEHGRMPLAIGGQDCAATENGAYTGAISAEMLKDAGCTHVILGHSERRQYFGETSKTVAAKAARAHGQGLVTIICVGETEAERAAGKEFDIVGAQLAQSLPDSAKGGNTVIAYEPIWAIGTGKSATAQDIGAMHSFIHGKLQEKLADSAEMRILYGGSVKPENAASIFGVEHVDGALIGGASLKAEQFIGIAKAA